jgi:UDP-glucuronate 4-epimerase
MKIFISGVAGFIGYHLSCSLLSKDIEILGVDNLNNYYDTKLKKNRLENLLFKKNFKFLQLDLLNQDNLKTCFVDFNPDIVINLAAQAGVRYSSINPSSYLDSNILSFLNILNLSEVFEAERFIYASSSSVYGDEKKNSLQRKFRKP